MKKISKNLILQIIAGLFILALIVSGVIQVQKEKEQERAAQEKVLAEYEEAKRLERERIEDEKRQRNEFYSLIEEFMVNKIGLKRALRDERFQKYVINKYSEGYLDKMKEIVQNNGIFQKYNDGSIVAIGEKDVMTTATVTINPNDTTEIIPLKIKMECYLKEYDRDGKLNTGWTLDPGKDEFGDRVMDLDRLMSKTFRPISQPSKDKDDHSIKIFHQRDWGLFAVGILENSDNFFITFLWHVNKIMIKNEETGEIKEILTKYDEYDEEVEKRKGFLSLFGKKAIDFTEAIRNGGDKVKIAFITSDGSYLFEIENYYDDLIPAIMDNGFKYYGEYYNNN